LTVAGLGSGHGGSQVRIEHYRAKAAEAEENARQAQDPHMQATYLQAAASWHRLADHAEDMELEQKAQHQSKK
jgi:hypothetical protein